MPRQAHQETIIDNDYFDDDEVDDDIMDEEFNPSFTINQSLLNERVYPVVINDLYYFIDSSVSRLYTLQMNNS